MNASTFDDIAANWRLAITLASPDGMFKNQVMLTPPTRSSCTGINKGWRTWSSLFE
jgi:hypothetical protein